MIKQFTLYENAHTKTPLISDLFANKAMELGMYLLGQASLESVLENAGNSLSLDLAAECAIQAPLFALEAIGRSLLGHAASLCAVELWEAGYKGAASVSIQASADLSAYIAGDLRARGLNGIAAQFFLLQHAALSELVHETDIERTSCSLRTWGQISSNASQVSDLLFHLSTKGILRRAYKQLWSSGESILKVAMVIKAEETPPSLRECCG